MGFTNNAIASLGHKYLKGFLTIIICLLILIIIIIVVFAGGIVSEENSNCSNDAISGSITVKGGINGVWTQRGTKAYQIAKAIFLYLVKEEGFSGAGAAGAVANAARESNFDLKAHNSGGGVIGLFQWSGWGNNVNGDRIHRGGFINSLNDLTFSKEMKLVHYELTHGLGRVKSVVGKANDPEKAAEQWSVLYEGVNLSDKQTKVQQLHADANNAYRLFGGSKYNANSSLLGSSAKSAGDSAADQSGDNHCDNEDGIDGSGPIIDQAKHFLGYFSYGGHDPVAYGGWKHPNKNGVTDCSGFVWLVMKRAGYNVGNTPFFTGTMEEDAKGKHQYLKKILPKDAKAGDIIIMNIGSGSGSNGHTAIIAGKYLGSNTKIIEMGGDSRGKVHVSTVQNSFISLIRGGVRVTWARPIKRG